MGNRGAVIGGRIVFNRMLGLGSGSLVSFPFTMVLVRLELAFLFLVLLMDVSFSAGFSKWHLMGSIMVHGPTIF